MIYSITLYIYYIHFFFLQRFIKGLVATVISILWNNCERKMWLLLSSIEKCLVSFFCSSICLDWFHIPVEIKSVGIAICVLQQDTKNTCLNPNESKPSQTRMILLLHHSNHPSQHECSHESHSKSHHRCIHLLQYYWLICKRFSTMLSILFMWK
jgi:hypothetical protein